MQRLTTRKAKKLFRNVNSKNRTLMKKITLVDALHKEYQIGFFILIDLSVSNKKNHGLTQLITQKTNYLFKMVDYMFLSCCPFCAPLVINTRGGGDWCVDRQGQVNYLSST
jgi:hypothetical protein